MPIPRAAQRPWSALRPWIDAPRMEGVAPALHALRDLDDFPTVPALDARLGPLLPRHASGGRYTLCEDRPARPRRGQPRPVSDRYDVVIDARGEIPTRPGNWHDLFNACVWASFPRAKARLSARQRRMLLARTSDGEARAHARTRAQDAMALLDEGGALTLCAAGDLDSLTRDLLASPPEALWALARAGRARVLLFGHAVLEHLLHDEPVRAAVVPLAVSDPCAPLDLLRAHADLALAARLDDDTALTEPGPFAAAPCGP